MNPEEQLLNTPGLTQGQLTAGFLGQANARPATPGQPNSSIIAQMLKKLREMLQPGGQP
jgi:hypothetical protein